jgi:hypothetical protein
MRSVPSNCNYSDPDAGSSPERLLADAVQKDLGVTIDPQALRIFLRWRWDRVQQLAHKIHDAV